MTRQRDSGFTLVEVMVALAIIAIALTAAAAKMGRMVDTSNSMRERTYASWIAQNKITEMRLANVIPEVSSTSGDVDFANTNWEWRAVVAESGIENLYRVDVIRTVTGFIGEPAAPGQANRVWRLGAQNPGAGR